MKLLQKARWLGILVGLGLAGSGVVAQESEGDQTQVREGEMLQVETQMQTRSQVRSEADWQDALPELLNRERLRQSIQERIEAFRALRLEYIERKREQLELLRRANSEEQREVVREQLRQERAEWLLEAHAVRRQAQERVQEMRDALPSHQEMLDEARTQVREQVRQGVEAARERVRAGTD